MSDAVPMVGDIWQEVDPRMTRFVKVTKVWPDSVFVMAVQHEGGAWVAVRNPKTNRYAPERNAQLKRFNGKRGGYALHERPFVQLDVATGGES